jgi:hypothetical protein
MENRHGLAVAGMVTLANGTAERRASETMLKAKAKEAGRAQWLDLKVFLQTARVLVLFARSLVNHRRESLQILNYKHVLVAFE